MNENKTNINWYPGHMAKTKKIIVDNIKFIDVVYELIDARIPYSSKIKDMDDIIKNKKKILIMTKYDLCDKVETDKWIKYYENNGYRVLCLNLESNKPLNNLIDLTKNIMKDENNKRIEKGMKERKIRALVVGIPNVGKSTLINRLVGKKVANVGNKPGITKNVSWIRVNNDIELLDTPGILWPKFDNDIVALNLASFSAIKEEILPMDKVSIHILNVLDRYYNNILVERYKINNINNKNLEETMDTIGKNKGCYLKGGIIDYDKVYTFIINDVKSGIINNITFDRYGDINE